MVRVKVLGNPDITKPACASDFVSLPFIRAIELVLTDPWFEVSEQDGWEPIERENPSGVELSIFSA